MLNLHVLLTIWLYLINCTRDNNSRAPFLLKSGEDDVTLTSFTANLAKPWKIPLVRQCKIDNERSI